MDVLRHRAATGGEDDVYTAFGPGYLKEWDYTPVRALKAEALLYPLSGERPNDPWTDAEGLLPAGYLCH